MKKLVSVLLALLLTLSLVPALAEDCTIVATPSPHAEILELIKDDLKAAGYDPTVVMLVSNADEFAAVNTVTEGEASNEKVLVSAVC